MSVRIGGEEGPAEVHRNRLLQDRGAFALPIGAERFDFFVGLDRHRQFSGVGCAARRGLDVAAGPEPKPEIRREFEHDEVRRGIERLAIEQASVKSGARLRLVDIEQDEMRQAHWDRSFS